MTYYHNIAVNVPLRQLFTYASDVPLPVGMRVVVPFRHRPTAGIVWESNITPSIDKEKILSISTIWEDETPLPQQWLDLISFASSYYHYPLGATAFTGLPVLLRNTKPSPPAIIEKHYTLSATENILPPKHKRQLALWQALQQQSLTLSQMKKIHPQAERFLSEWQEYLHETAIEKVDFRKNSVCLNEEQKIAQKAVCDELHHFVPFLLLGVTGSGKTETYFEIMAEVFSQGRQVLFMLPEIALTEVLLKRIRQRFPHMKTAVMTGNTAGGQRSQDFISAMQGNVDLVIGTRVSVFTPLPHLGLIVVDEEHDHSFKQDNELRYNARDLAIWRAKQANCPIVLGSATPCLESFQAALHKRYRLLQITKRAKPDAQLPAIILDDMRLQKPKHGIGDLAMHHIKRNLENGNMTMIYLNRRGFAPALICTDCGHGFHCPHCSAHMVLHYQAKELRCHHCDHHFRLPEKCPSCGNIHLTAIGQGTQRVEDNLSMLFPTARIARIDRDSMTRKDDWEKLYQRMMSGEIDIMVGTQILAKGHNFPNLNLVIVLNADGSLYSADLRATERLFSELMQVSGRAGRDGDKGKVIIQTRQPEHPIFADLQQQDYHAFAMRELATRQEYHAPPTCRVVAIRADAPSLKEALLFLQTVLQSFRLPENITAFGPAPHMFMRLKGRERAQIFLESENRPLLHQTIQRLIPILEKQIKKQRHVQYSLDIDPLES